MFRIETAADQHRRQLIESRLRQTNDRLSPVMRGLRGTDADNERPVQLYAFAEDGEGSGVPTETVPTGSVPTDTERADTGPADPTPAGGLIGYVWGGWLHIDLLWVDAPHRGTGLGSRLVTRAEERAVELGCGHSRVETWDFQAPNFYRKLGYSVVGVVEDYPPGVTDHLLIKSLR